MSFKLQQELDKLLKQEMTAHKKQPSFEEVFEKTLDITTPEQPGDLRRHRVWKEKPDDELDEWI